MGISSSQKGRVIEQLVGATLILQSNGALRVSLPLVDDEGVDLVVSNRSNDKTLLLQIKGRFSLNKGSYRTYVRRSTCTSKSNKFLLFVYYDKEKTALFEKCWLVPASKFCKLLSNQSSTQRYTFQSTFESNDMWKHFRYQLKDTAATILKELR